MEAAMARRTKAEAEQTRLRILKAALDLFVEKGYERATFEDVARRIRLSKGAVYWHFKTKADLLSELVAHMTALHTERVSGALPLPDTLEGLKAHFVARAKLVAGTPANRKFFHMMMRLDWPSAKFEPVKQRLRQLETGPFFIIEHTLSDLRRAGVVRADVDVSVVTAVLGAMWLGLINHEVGKCLDVELTRTLEFGFEAVIAAIRA
jgi:TetR/AcrR family acrAB operon transcriptional repressor